MAVVVLPVQIFKDLQAVSNAPVELDPLRAKLSNAALGAARSTEQLVSTASHTTRQPAVVTTSPPTLT